MRTLSSETSFVEIFLGKLLGLILGNISSSSFFPCHGLVMTNWALYVLGLDPMVDDLQLPLGHGAPVLVAARLDLRLPS